MLTTPQSSGILAENYLFLQKHIYSHAGIVLEADKHYLFESRLEPIVRELGLASINDLVALLKSRRNTAVERQVVEAMTTNETYFFRDPAHYDAIRKTLVPELKEKRQDHKKLRFWSAASSTGQEAYSLAMALLEEGLADWNIQILGTDYSSGVLEKARAGTYKQIEVNRGLPASLLIKYFRHVGMEWHAGENLRRLVRFDTIDLRQSLRTLGPFDLVFCRNVMIYFDAATKKKLIEEIHGTLYRGGWLLVGGAESALGVEQWFDRLVIGSATVYIAR